MNVGERGTEQESVKSPGELENQYTREEERGRVRVCVGAGDKGILFHAARIRISM